MLFSEWNLEDALVVEREEGREEGHKEGLEIGRKEGLEIRKIEIAKAGLAQGISFDIIRKITGLDIETIEKLSAH